MTQFYPFRTCCAYAFVQEALSGGVRWTQIREFQFKDLHHQNSDDVSTVLLILQVAMLKHPIPSTHPMAQARSNDTDPSVGPFVLQNHKACMEAARWAWQGALGIHLLPKCPRSISDWATWATGMKIHCWYKRAYWNYVWLVFMGQEILNWKTGPDIFN